MTGAHRQRYLGAAQGRRQAQLAAAGLTGIAVSFVNYLDELPYFCAEVLPRLARSGLREEPGAI